MTHTIIGRQGIVLAAFSTEDQREEQPIAIITSNVALSFESQHASLWRIIDGAIDRAALGDELVEFEGKSGLILGVAHGAADLEEVPDLRETGIDCDAGSLG